MFEFGISDPIRDQIGYVQYQKYLCIVGIFGYFGYVLATNKVFGYSLGFRIKLKKIKNKFWVGKILAIFVFFG